MLAASELYSHAQEMKILNRVWGFFYCKMKIVREKCHAKTTTLTNKALHLGSEEANLSPQTSPVKGL